MCRVEWRWWCGVECVVWSGVCRVECGTVRLRLRQVHVRLLGESIVCEFSLVTWVTRLC